MSKEERFVKSSPSLMKTSIWLDDALFKLYHYCQYKASRNAYHWKGLVLQPGDLPISLRNAARELGWSINKLRSKLQLLCDCGYISLISGRQGTLVRINAKPSDCSSDALDVSDGETSACASTDGKYSNVSITETACFSNEYTGVSEIDTGCVNHRYASVSIADTNQEGYQEDSSSYCTTTTSELNAFQRLWLAYPQSRRNRREEATQLFRAALANGATIEAMLAALDFDRRSESWQESAGRFIPGIVKWLQRESWRDYVQPTIKEDEKWTSR